MSDSNSMKELLRRRFRREFPVRVATPPELSEWHNQPHSIIPLDGQLEEVRKKITSNNRTPITRWVEQGELSLMDDHATPPPKPLWVVLAQIKECYKHADDSRLELAILLAEAHRRVENAEDEEQIFYFKDWCAKHLPDRDYKDILKLVKIGNANDPETAMRVHREKTASQNRQYQERQREQRATAIAAMQRFAGGVAHVSDGHEETETRTPAEIANRIITLLDLEKENLLTLSLTMRFKVVRDIARKLDIDLFPSNRNPHALYFNGDLGS